MAKILIVEDEPNMVAGLRDNFEFEGYLVITAPDGAAGLERAVRRVIRQREQGIEGKVGSQRQRRDFVWHERCRL